MKSYFQRLSERKQTKEEIGLEIIENVLGILELYYRPNKSMTPIICVACTKIFPLTNQQHQSGLNQWRTTKTSAKIQTKRTPVKKDQFTLVRLKVVKTRENDTSVKKDQFTLVRLKVVKTRENDTSVKKDQFTLVRLKVVKTRENDTSVKKDQFTLVRLKVVKTRENDTSVKKDQFTLVRLKVVKTRENDTSVKNCFEFRRF